MFVISLLFVCLYNAEFNVFPTLSPTNYPTSNPIVYPTQMTTAPTEQPTTAPTEQPTTAPTEQPTSFPTKSPTSFPTKSPTSFPTEQPTDAPTSDVTAGPTLINPITEAPTQYLAHNDRTCDIPTKWYSLTEIEQLLGPINYYTGLVVGVSHLLVNIAPRPGPPNYIIGSVIEGVFDQWYDAEIGSLRGMFYINVSGVLVPTVANTFRISDDNKLTSYNSYCITGNGYIRADITAQNFVHDTYIYNKAFNNVGSMQLGDTYASEYFRFFGKDESLNCVTDFSNTGIDINYQLCSYFKKIPSTSLKRSIFNNVEASETVDDGYVLKIGKYSIPRALIPDRERHHYKFTSSK